MKYLVSVSLLASFSGVHSWVTGGRKSATFCSGLTHLRASEKFLDIGKSSAPTANPCWENVYDEDCVMENIVSAAFMASLSSDWIESMPCATRTEEIIDIGKTSAPTATDPCWENVYNEDCVMENIVSAAFVASDWIKSMPCATGIKDCDVPEKLKMPGIHKTAGINKVDVMDFLSIKRAEPLTKSTHGLAP